MMVGATCRRGSSAGAAPQRRHPSEQRRLGEELLGAGVEKWSGGGLLLVVVCVASRGKEQGSADAGLVAAICSRMSKRAGRWRHGLGRRGEQGLLVLDLGGGDAMEGEQG